MNKTYIPAGLTVKHTELHTDTIVVNGALIVSGAIICKQIIGKGYVQAKSIVCDNIKMRTVSVEEYVVANNVIVNRLMADTCSISGELIAKDYLQARHIHAYKVVTVLSAIQSSNVKDFIAVPYKKRSMMLFLLAASLRSWWAGFLTSDIKENKKQSEQEVQPPNINQTNLQDKADIPEIAQAVAENTEMLKALLGILKPKTKRKISIMPQTDNDSSNAA